MRDMKIEITKARIRSYSVTLGDKSPVVNATIELLTDGGKVITSYSISNEHWQEHMKFELPPQMVRPITEIADQLEKIVSKHCENSCKLLEVA